MNPTKLREGAKATTLSETVAAGSHLTTSRREPGGGPHGRGGRHAFDDISGGLTPSAAHLCLAPLAVSLNFSLTLSPTPQSDSLDSLAQHTFDDLQLLSQTRTLLIPPLFHSSDAQSLYECLLPRPKNLEMRGRSRPCSSGSSGPRHLRVSVRLCECVCARARARVCMCVCVCVCV